MTATTEAVAATTPVQEQATALHHLGGKNMSSLPSTPTSASSETSQALSETFFVESTRRKHSMKIQVKLCPEGVYLRGETDQDDHINEQLIRIDDIVGSRYGPRLKKRPRGGLNSCKNPSGDAAQEQEQQPDRDNSAYLYIYAYLKKEKPLRRVQTLRILRFRSSIDYAENLQTAELWNRTIRELKQRNSITIDISGSILRSGSGSVKHLLILLNPKSGSGKGRELFQKQVAPLLTEAEVQYDLQVTTHPQYAQEFVRTRKDLLERYSGIVVASGDGLFYEVLNGLMERMDWRRACRNLPLGIIPCGSGNGLAKSVAHHCNEPYEPKPIFYATLTCIAGRSTPMDVVRVELSSRDKHYVMYSFLSVGWGLIADIDIESERLRSIGAQRFTLWAIKRLISLRTYKGKVFYLPYPKEEKKEQQETAATATPTAASPQEKETPLQLPVEEQAPPSRPISLPLNVNGDVSEESEFRDLPEDLNVESETEMDPDQFADALSMDRSIFRQHADSWHSAMSRRTAYYSVGGQSIRSNRSRMSVSQRIEAANEEFAELVPSGTIPGLQLPLPAAEGWCCEEGEFVMVHAAYTTHLSSDCYFAPDSRLNDGIIYLVIIRGGVGRHQMLNFLLSMNTGTHLPPGGDDPFIRVVPVKAFRIEPCGSDGILVVDGERVDYGPIQAEVLPGLINVMTTNGQ